MKEIKIHKFDSWYPYDGFAEGSGRSEKIWLESPSGKIGLFKFPKSGQEVGTCTSEHVSEHLAYNLGRILGVPIATVDIGTYEGRIGCMSYQINENHEELIEAALFITEHHSQYNMEDMIDYETGKYYCLEHVFEIASTKEMRYRVIQMMVFDFLIGNSDRHQNNWAIIRKYSTRKHEIFPLRISPLYDNGSSLCCYVNENIVSECLGKDKNRFRALVDSKSRSMIRIDGYKKNRPTHMEMVKYLFENYPETSIIFREFLDKLNHDTVDKLVDLYDGLVSQNKIKLIKMFLHWKMDTLSVFLKDGGKSEY